MLLFKVVVVLSGMGILVVVAGLLLYDAGLALNFQSHSPRGKAETPPTPAFPRPSVFLYQRALAARATQPMDVRVLRIRRRVRAWRRATRRV